MLEQAGLYCADGAPASSPSSRIFALLDIDRFGHRLEQLRFGTHVLIAKSTKIEDCVRWIGHRLDQRILVDRQPRIRAMGDKHAPDATD